MCPQSPLRPVTSGLAGAAAAARSGAATATAYADDSANTDTHTGDRPYGCPRSDSLFQFLDFKFQAFHFSLSL